MRLATCSKISATRCSSAFAPSMMSSSPWVRMFTLVSDSMYLRFPSWAPYSASSRSCGSAIFLMVANSAPSFQAELLQLARIDRRRRARHEVHRRSGLGKRDHLSGRRLAGQQRCDPIEAEGDAAMRRRAVFKSLEEEPKAELCLIVADVEQGEDATLHRRIVDPDAATADLAAVQDEI